MYTISVRVKKLGKQKKESLVPMPFELEERPENVRELILGLTRAGVRDYNRRKDEGQLLSWLTKEEMENQAQRGKISFGLRGGNDADLEKAEGNAVQSFEDGIYRIFAGETELKALEEKIPWEEGMVFTLIRLAMLSGW